MAHHIFFPDTTTWRSHSPINPRRAVCLVVSLVLLLGVALLWVDSAFTRSAASVYSPLGFLTTVHHGGHVDLSASDVVIPLGGSRFFSFSGDRTRKQEARFLPPPDFERVTGQHGSVTRLAIPYWLIFLTVTGNIFLVVLVLEVWASRPKVLPIQTNIQL